MKLLFRKRKEVTTLAKYAQSETAESIEDITNKLKDVEHQIGLTTKAILQAQLVRVRSIFTKDTNLLMGFQRKFVESSANSSAQWHQNQLLLLQSKRRRLQIELDRLTGKTWQRRVSNWVRLISISTIILFAFSIIIMGLFTALYLLPIFAMLILGFVMLQKIKG